MPYDTQVQQLLEELIVANRPSSRTLPLPEGRRNFKELFVKYALTTEVEAVEERDLPSPGGNIPIRIYRPSRLESLPIVVYFHGGGWVFGDLETADATARMLARESGAEVVAVHYRRPPDEAIFPGPLDDCYAATRWVYEHAAEIGGDSNRVAVVGDSSGGQLAAAVALRSRDEGGPPLAFQLLFFPALAYDFATASYSENADDPFLSKDEMVWYWAQYVPRPEDAQHPYVSPLFAKDLHGLPPTFIVTCEFDPLRDEGEAYADRLKDAGVPVRVSRYDGTPHGFLMLGRAIDAAAVAYREAGQVLRDAFSAHMPKV